MALTVAQLQRMHAAVSMAVSRLVQTMKLLVLFLGSRVAVQLEAISTSTSTAVQRKAIATRQRRLSISASGSPTGLAQAGLPR